jgi:bifunctional non-homologous end joining protein LigD
MPKIRKGDVVWVEPRLVAEVEFAQWTHDGHLRAPSYKGLREDKPAEDVMREEPQPLPDVIESRGRTLRLSNLDKPFWAEEGITKGDLLAYYRDVAAVLVPHLKDRPFTMKRYPDGWKGKFFFQKDAPSRSWSPRANHRGNARRSRRPSSTTSLRCCGWSTWPAST